MSTATQSSPPPSRIMDLVPNLVAGGIGACCTPLVTPWVAGWWQWALHSRPPDWLGTTAGNVIPAVALILLFGAVVEPIKRAWRARTRTRSVAKAKGDRLAIAVAALKGDDADGRLAHRVVLALEQELGTRVEIIAGGPSVLLGTRGNSNERNKAAAAEARKLAQRANADVVIWGEAHGAEHVLDLYFTTSGNNDGVHSYALTPVLRLPPDFNADFFPAIAAVALTASAPAVDDAGKYLVPLLGPLVSKLSHFVASPPSSLIGDAKASVFFAYGLATSTLGEQSGDNAALERSITAYREALKERTRDKVPLDWAMTQNNLGNALSTLGARESGTERLEEAVTAYREALKEYTRDKVPLQWAMTQNNLGNALSTLGARESGTERLEEAVTAYREALKEFRADNAPYYHEHTKRNLAGAEAILAERKAKQR